MLKTTYESLEVSFPRPEEELPDPIRSLTMSPASPLPSSTSATSPLSPIDHGRGVVQSRSLLVGRCWRAPQVRERVGGEGVERVDADAGGQVAGATVAKEAGHPGQPREGGRWRSLQGEGVGRGTRGLASSKSRSHTSSSSKSSTSLTSSTSTCSTSSQLRYGVDDGHGLHVPRVPLHPVAILSQ